MPTSQQYGPTERRHRVARDVEAAAAEVAQLRRDFAGVDDAGRQALLEVVHDRRRLLDYAAGDDQLSAVDARLVVANRHGYALWSKYEAYLHLDPAVKDVIAAVLAGDLDRVRVILSQVPAAANPIWADGYEPREADEKPEIPNDPIPLFCVSKGVFDGTNGNGNEGDIARALLDAGADPDLAGQPMEGAVSFNCPAVVAALIEAGADLEGPAPGVFMAYPMLFGFTEVCQLLASAGVRLDLRFAAGLGRLDEMERWIDGDGGLKPDPGLADPYTRSVAARGDSAVRHERTDDVVLGQALLYACLHDRRAAAEWLVARGADVNALVRGTDVDATVLHRMVTYAYGATCRKDSIQDRRRPMVRWLLDHGADPTIPDAAHGVDALHWAAHSGMVDLGSLLLSTQPRSRLVAPAATHESAYDAAIRDWGARLLVEADDVDGVLTYLHNNPGSGPRLMAWAHRSDADGRLAQALLDAGVARADARDDGTGAGRSSPRPGCR